MAHDPTFDWRNDDSADRKAAIMHERFEGQVPDYLWYALGDLAESDRRDLTDKIKVALFGENALGFGDIEFHKSRTPGVGVAMRIRGAVNALPKVSLNDHDFFMYQFGHADDPRFFSFDDQWKKATFMPGSRVQLREEYTKLDIGPLGVGQYSCVPSPRQELTVIETR